MPQLDTVIFDMDGILIDSEPLWDEAANEVFHDFNVHLSPEAYATTVGLRTREFLEHWFLHFNIANKHLKEAENKIVAGVIRRVQEKGQPMKGVGYILDFFKSRQFKIGLATSSPLSLVEVVIDITETRNYFQSLTSAQDLPYGKPHPMVYLNCLSSLSSQPNTSLCFEDSFNGMIAAKASKMKCVIIPAENNYHNNKWLAADAKLHSLEDFDEEQLKRINL